MSSESMDPNRIRQMKIKSGVVKRLSKEKVSYEKELEKQQEKVEKMKTENKDEYDIRKQIEVMEESRMMIPDCERRLMSSWDELAKLLESEEDLKDCTEYQAAKCILEDTRAAIKR